jgi:hypothetical protein
MCLVCVAVYGSVFQCAAVCGIDVAVCAAIDLQVSTFLFRYTSANSNFVTVRQCAGVCCSASSSVWQCVCSVMQLPASAAVCGCAAVYVRQCCSVG